MRSLGRLIAASLVAGSLFVGCLAAPPGERVVHRAPTKVEAIGRVDQSTAESAAPQSESATVVTAVTAAPVVVAPPGSARTARRTRTFGGRPAAARPASPAPAHTPRSTWERMEGEVGAGPYSVARAAREGLPVSTSPGQEPAIHLANPTPNGSPRVVLVVAEEADWLKVLLPIRPNRSLGWVKRADVSITTHGYSVVVEQAAHRIRVYDGASVIVDQPVAVGKGSTPTPTGQFFVTDLLQPSNPNGAYGPYAFGLSGYSDVYQRFGNGDGVVGIHGTNDPSSVGRDASHGCIRVTNDVIRHLASFLPLATPVAIRP